ncbi:MAG: hypothetical protein ACW99A_20385 [Candidatus Kariarchaeaceae archaeon]|jgi:hypothetical protein
MEWEPIIALFVTVLLAILGYYAAYLNNLRINRRKNRLDRVNSQLKDLYGPLFSLEQASSIAWIAFRNQYRPNRPYWGIDDLPTEDEKVAW